MRDTVDVAKWIQAGYKQGHSVMNATIRNENSFLDQRMNRGLKSNDAPRQTSNDKIKNYSIF